ncbi:hypothetical protein K2X05_03080 [bacterium]|nr:hypothetical protein [bacterium]
MIKYLMVVCSVALIVVFQNCSKQQFSARTDLNKSMSLDGSEQLIQDEISDDVVSNDSGGSASGGSASGGSMNGGSTSAGSMTAGHHKEDEGDDDDDHVASYDKDDDDKDYDKEDDKKDEATSSEDGKKGKKVCMRHGEKIIANEVGICVVEGPGQSNQISLVNDKIVVNNETPKSVCMTAFACRKIVDGKFRVVTLKKTGFCKNGSADSVQLSDQQVKELMDKI